MNPPLRMLILLTVFWAAGSLLLAAESPSAAKPKPATETQQPAAKAGEAVGEAKSAEAKPAEAKTDDTKDGAAAKDGTSSESGDKRSIAEQAEAALKAAAEADASSAASAAGSNKSGDSVGQDDTQAPPSGGSSKGPSPQRFVPTEQVRADFDVSFPIDI